MFTIFSRRAALGLLAGGALASLNDASAATGGPADQKLATLARIWLAGLLRLRPVTATNLGEHRYDEEIEDVSAAGRAEYVAFLKARLAGLARIDRTALSRANQVDAAILENHLRFELWDIEVLQSWAWDPQGYNDLAGNALYLLMARDFAPLPVRLKSATARMEKLPRVFALARSQLQIARTPKIHAETVAKQNKGVLTLIDALVKQQDALEPADAKRLAAAASALKAAVEEHQIWLDHVLAPGAVGEFRLGAKLYDEKLAFALNSPLSRQEIRARAEAEFAATRHQMYQIARTVMAGRPGAPPAPDAPDDAQQQALIAAAMELAYAERPSRAGFVAACEAATRQATAFVNAKMLVTTPNAPVKVIVTPEFQRGVSGAHCDPPGPLEKGQDTFFVVDPLPDEWTQAQVDSYLRENNSRNVHEIAIHEAMPGHYLQLWHSNNYPSVLRAILYSGPFVEGWACYAEDLMAEQGYLGFDPLYRLVHLKLRLRSILNAILDQAVHVDGISREEAIAMMTTRAFQQESEATGKWRRAQLTSAQLPTYFVGLSEHIALRAEAERRQGGAFALKAYHDKVLSFGSPPVRYVRALMFDEPLT